MVVEHLFDRTLTSTIVCVLIGDFISVIIAITTDIKSPVNTQTFVEVKVNYSNAMKTFKIHYSEFIMLCVFICFHYYITIIAVSYYSELQLL